MGCHFLLPGIFPTQDQTCVSCILDSLPMSHQGSPWGIRWAAPCGSAGEESAYNAGDLVSIPGLGRSPGEGKGYPLQYSGLENSVECIAHGATKSWTRLNLKYIVCNGCCRGESSTQRVFMSLWPILPCLQSNWVSRSFPWHLSYSFGWPSSS